MGQYSIPVLTKDGKHLALRQHVAQHSGYPISTINKLISDGKLEMHLINYKSYIDLEEAFAVLGKQRYGSRKRLVVDPQNDLFAS